MATNYLVKGSSSDNTDFDEDEARVAIANATQRRYESIHDMDRDRSRSNFTGFRGDDRPSMHYLSLLALNEN